ncbi:MAG: RNA polymerase sigma factor [Candidatus Sericytochromatia bacterium]
MSNREIDSTSDALMRTFLRGNRQSFDALVRLWKKPLLNYFYYQVRQLPLAEELTQEVFIRVYRSRSYHSQGRFSAWIYRIARHLLLDHLRRRQLETCPADEDFLQLSSLEPTPEARLLHQEEQQNVQALLEAMSPEDRELLFLSQIQDLSYQEIAEIMNVSLNSVKGKIYRSVQRWIKKFREGTSHVR